MTEKKQSADYCLDLTFLATLSIKANRSTSICIKVQSFKFHKNLPNMCVTRDLIITVKHLNPNNSSIV